jgi:hypothetical protein
VTPRILEHMSSYDVVSVSKMARNLELTMLMYLAMHSCSLYLQLRACSSSFSLVECPSDDDSSPLRTCGWVGVMCVVCVHARARACVCVSPFLTLISAPCSFQNSGLPPCSSPWMQRFFAYLRQIVTKKHRGKRRRRHCVLCNHVRSPAAALDNHRKRFLLDALLHQIHRHRPPSQHNVNNRRFELCREKLFSLHPLLHFVPPRAALAAEVPAVRVI